jgi:A/G-specific adenine glycosylase
LSLQVDLLAWFATEARDLPWRRRRDPYSALVSEVMLQQTTVEAVAPYFVRWMAELPTVEALAGADEDRVAALWAGLGYYSRCRNLQAAARRIVAEGWPTDRAGWLALPGVGRYTAGAVCSLALGLDEAVVDGNVARVYARLTGDGSAPPTLLANAWAWAEAAFPRGRAGEWNEALMELGARVCRPKSPTCAQCPVSIHCQARTLGTVDRLPTARRPKQWVDRTLHVWVPVRSGEVGFRRAQPGEWWAGLWIWPWGESPEPPAGLRPIEALPDRRHTVTRHRLTLKPHTVSGDAEGLVWFANEAASRLALPAPHRRVFESLLAARTGNPA